MCFPNGTSRAPNSLNLPGPLPLKRICTQRRLFLNMFFLEMFESDMTFSSFWLTITHSSPVLVIGYLPRCGVVFWAAEAVV